MGVANPTTKSAGTAATARVTGRGHARAVRPNDTSALWTPWPT